MRRYSQRSTPVDSSIHRAWTCFTAAPVAAYWPMEDGADAGQIASGSGGQPMYFGDAPAPCSWPSNMVTSRALAALPVTNGASFHGNVQPCRDVDR